MRTIIAFEFFLRSLKEIPKENKHTKTWTMKFFALLPLKKIYTRFVDLTTSRTADNE